MDWVILDAFDTDRGLADRIGTLLRSRLDQRGKSHVSFRLNEMEIAPCRSCGACGFKSPGKCVINDDQHQIMRAVARCSVLAFLTPIRFGAYPSNLKKALERFMNLGEPTYFVHKGKLMHPMRYGEKSLLSIGVAELDTPLQLETFRLLSRRNAQNLLSPHHQTVILKPGAPEQAIGPALEEALLW